jgi:UDP-N-acetylmuramoyl-L-alanyl-D-glutamate--2,6-diaminopimelate ligase
LTIPERSVALTQLVRHLPEEPEWTGGEASITGIALDSRRVEPGFLFFALPGGSTDGHRYIPEAIQRGAGAVVGTRHLPGLPAPYLRVGDSRQALAYLSAAFYGFPARRLTMIGVTGTDGKTTTANLIYQILQAAGLRAGMITTVNAVIGEQVLDTGFHVTTPEAPEVQYYLAQMAAAGLTHVVLEATSHGLEQRRVGACEFDLGVVTNITHEHLDYHGNYAEYRAAKARLFTELATTSPKPHGSYRVAVLNRDDGSFEYLDSVVRGGSGQQSAISSQRSAISDQQEAGSVDGPKDDEAKRTVSVVTYGLHPEAQVRAEDSGHQAGGLRFTAVGPGFRMPVESRLVGDFNVSNCLAAIATSVIGLGLDPRAAQQGVATLAGIPGRMELIDLGQEFLTIVDFAHTPNALRRALETARQLASGRVIAVFGSAGRRDREKRRMMAEISAELADVTVLTAEDPRTESLEEILAEMAAGAAARGGVAGESVWSVPDRREAIRFAISLAQPGDVVIACGKGHEQSMCFGETEYPWDDRIAMRAALAEYLGLPGPAMPYLPNPK